MLQYDSHGPLLHNGMTSTESRMPYSTSTNVLSVSQKVLVNQSSISVHQTCSKDPASTHKVISNVELNTSAALPSSTGDECLLDATLPSAVTIPPRAPTQAEQDRFCDLVEIIGPQLNILVKSYKNVCKPCSIKLRIHIKSNDIHQPHLSVLCDRRIERKVRKLLEKKSNLEHIISKHDSTLPTFEFEIIPHAPLRFNNGNSTGYRVEIDMKTVSKNLCGARIRCVKDGKESFATLGGLVLVEKDNKKNVYGLTVAHLITGVDSEADGLSDEAYEDFDCSSSESGLSSLHDSDHETASSIEREERQSSGPQGILKSQHDTQISRRQSDFIHYAKSTMNADIHSSMKTVLPSRPSPIWEFIGHIKLIEQYDDGDYTLTNRENLDWALIEFDPTSALFAEASYSESHVLDNDALTDKSHVQNEKSTKPAKLFSFAYARAMSNDEQPYMNERTAKLLLEPQRDYWAIVSLLPAFLLLPPSDGFIKAYTLRMMNDSKLSQGDSGTWVVDQTSSNVMGVICAQDSDEDLYTIPMESITDQIKQSLRAQNVLLCSPENSGLDFTKDTLHWNFTETSGLKGSGAAKSGTHVLRRHHKQESLRSKSVSMILSKDHSLSEAEKVAVHQSAGIQGQNLSHAQMSLDIDVPIKSFTTSSLDPPPLLVWPNEDDDRKYPLDMKLFADELESYSILKIGSLAELDSFKALQLLIFKAEMIAAGAGDAPSPSWRSTSSMRRLHFWQDRPSTSLTVYLKRIHEACPMSPEAYLTVSCYIDHLQSSVQFLVARQTIHRLVLTGLKVVSGIQWTYSELSTAGGISAFDLHLLETWFREYMGSNLAVSIDELELEMNDIQELLRHPPSSEELSNRIAPRREKPTMKEENGPDEQTDVEEQSDFEEDTDRDVKPTQTFIPWPAPQLSKPFSSLKPSYSSTNWGKRYRVAPVPGVD